MNGAIEAANKNIKRILQKIVDNHRQWHEKISFALLGYQTTMRTSIVAMLYMLVYRTEVVIPAEVEIPSLRVIQEAKLDDAEWIWVRQGQLMLISEKKIDTEEDKGKFAPNWQGPYVVHRVLLGGALIMAEMDGRINTEPINSDAIKRYFSSLSDSDCDTDSELELLVFLKANLNTRLQFELLFLNLFRECFGWISGLKTMVFGADFRTVFGRFCSYF
uniref:Integrase catalytic domain-containing protein n=1 Tax=Nicotiana tabacum TaxID=4097 RepID=A0A1S4AYG4_TOBAC|nr:PREDICTED: uncharacterized protein LOC107802537 [Nicotiana tabacum]